MLVWSSAFAVDVTRHLTVQLRNHLCPQHTEKNITDVVSSDLTHILFNHY